VTDGPEYFKLKVRRERRLKQYGQALELLNRNETAVAEDDTLLEKRSELYNDLGWQLWQDYEQHWRWRKFPGTQVPF